MLIFMCIFLKISLLLLIYLKKNVVIYTSCMYKYVHIINKNSFSDE